MKNKGVFKILLATLMLIAVAMAADPPKAMIVQHATEGRYFTWDSVVYTNVSIDALVYTAADRNMSTLSISVQDWTNSRSLVAYGVVPASVLKVTGNTLVVSIPDLRKLGPDFSILWETGYFPEPLAVNCTMTQTSDWTRKVVSQLTQVQPDGTVSKDAERYTESSLYVEGNVLGYLLPLNNAQYMGDYNYLRRGSYRVRGLP